MPDRYNFTELNSSADHNRRIIISVLNNQNGKLFIHTGGCESSTHTCTCDPGWTGLGCEMPDCAGDPDCNNNGVCNATSNPPHCR